MIAHTSALNAGAAHARETIPVTVRLNIGSTNIARAGVGAASKLASSTSDGKYAARAAAAKYFHCREVDIALTLLEQGDACSHGEKPARYMAERRAYEHAE